MSPQVAGAGLDAAHAAQSDLRPLKIAIAANFLTTPLRAAFALWLERLRVTSTPEFAPYDSVIQQLLDRNGPVSRADLAIILIRLENWCRQGRAISPEMARRNVDIFLKSVESAVKQQPGAVFLIITCPPSPAVRLDDALAAADRRLAAELEAIPNVDFVGVSDLSRYYPVADYHGYFIRGTGYEQDELHYSELCYATLSTMMARRISAHFAAPRKVIVVDCDNTLWSGVCGEQGPLGVTVGSGHRSLQQALLEQRERGRLLCVCSKNNEPDALAVFEHNPKMLLRREHFSAVRANWMPKVDNLRSLASELGLGLDAFIFVDDDPFECEAVATVFPEVRTVRMACADEMEVERTLLQVWELDKTSMTAEDGQRVAYYRQESERNSLHAALSLDEFLEQLDLKVMISELGKDGISRAVQLTQRVNQFNLNGIRRTTGEINARLGTATCLMVSASDRFGDYGVIGLIIYASFEHALRVETLVLSCRALGRGVEQRLAAHLADAAQASGLSQIEFEFLPTPKNAPIREFLANAGARHDGSERRVVLVDDLMRVRTPQA